MLVNPEKRRRKRKEKAQKARRSHAVVTARRASVLPVAANTPVYMRAAAGRVPSCPACSRRFDLSDPGDPRALNYGERLACRCGHLGTPEEMGVEIRSFLPPGTTRMAADAELDEFGREAQHSVLSLLAEHIDCFDGFTGQDQILAELDLACEHALEGDESAMLEAVAEARKAAEAAQLTADDDELRGELEKLVRELRLFESEDGCDRDSDADN